MLNHQGWFTSAFVFAYAKSWFSHDNGSLVTGTDQLYRSILSKSILYCACVRGSQLVPLVDNICIIRTNLIANCTIGKGIGTNGNQRTNGPVNAHLRPSYHFFDVKAYLSKINLAVK